MKLNELTTAASSFKKSEKMPVLFVGHGSPMNALEDNPFTQKLNRIGTDIRQRQTPTAILVVSAHFLTKGTYVTASPKPETIHDFGGFPEALFREQYPAPGSPEYAREIMKMVPEVQDTEEWGLDHGAWTILKHMFPEADIPVFELSLDYGRSPQYHFDLAQRLQFLRERGVLIIGSGNIVHNLRQSMPKLMAQDATPYDWAVEFDEWVKTKINQRDFQSLIDFHKAGTMGALSVPTIDHYLPVLYTLGLADKNENITQAYEEVYYGGLSMRTFIAG
ncbi:4,5-DOPA-extradiol-dioxygenase [Hymenobacter jejuensis]|uniref:4,5-DOPA dioxygenase extradiol n=1 Tax=Hymenobacter jejuensis TaxID=2502781 RepID=A0A5B8A5N5_9BACT|nr:4,5-DOPA dioxygenase extradiol [Hymenobacter jejuensis]QDA61522.1 4,5-DOPA dioxygenase extradiol [Hymenobacter jejuensis]